jgi:hypothetical protein
LVFAVSLVKNVLECKKTLVPMATLAALQGRTKCVTFAIALSIEISNYVLTAKISLVRSPKKDQ